MPRLSSRSKHVEFESNSALQIGNQKERRVEKAEKSSNFAEGCKNFAQCKFLHWYEIFAQCEFSHWCEIFALVRNFCTVRIFALVRNFRTGAKFRIGAKFSHWCEISHGNLPFDLFFVIFPIFALHVLWVLRVFLYFCLFDHYISSNEIL